MLKYNNNSTRVIQTIFIILILTYPVFSHNLYFQHLGKEDGLSQGTVHTILQDSKGLLWFGTQDGLNKFDGYNFEVLNQDLQQNNKLSGSHIISLYQDPNNLIWIGTWSGGLNLYDPILHRFQQFKFEPGVEQTVQNNKITAIIGDKYSENNIIWIATEGGGFSKLWYKNEDKHFFQHFKNNPNDKNSLSDNNVTSLLQDSDGFIWVGTKNGGLNKFNPKTNEFKIYSNFDESLCINNISSLYQTDERTLWIGTYGSGLVQFNPKTETCRLYKNNPLYPNSLSENKILCINSFIENNNIHLLIGTEAGGLNVFDIKNEQFKRYLHESNNDNGIAHNNVRNIYIEKAGNIWIGTDNGINIYDRYAYNFRKYKHIPGNSNSLSNNYVWAIHESKDGMLWVATDNGLNQIDRDKNKYSLWLHNPEDPTSISANEIMSIQEDKFGYLWVGTWFGGLNKFDREKNTFKHFYHEPQNPNSISDNNIRMIYEDPLGNGEIFWLGTKDGGLVKFNIITEKAVNYLHDPNDNSTISDNSILSVFRDKMGTLWIGTWGKGLNKFNATEQTFIHYYHDSNDPNSISSNSVSMIYEDESENLWIGTHGGGLNNFDRDNEVFVNYSTKDGLPNDVIYGILEDDDGYLWISTNKGITRFNPQDKGKNAFKNFDKTDGLQSNEFNNGAFYKSENGELFFGGTNGFNSFFPEKILENKYLPPVVFTDFKIFNKSVPVNPDSLLKKSILYAHKIELQYNHNVFSIEFSALNFTHPEKNQFKYKLIGFDNDWTLTDAKRRFVTYTNLSPGEYEFAVKASNNDGYWNEDNASLKITILPPFWLTWWFRFAIFTIIAGVILTWHTRRMNKVEKLNIKLESEVSKRTHELEEQKNEIQEALSQVKQLSGLLPICASCKKIRDDKGYWNQIESYIAKYSDADFSHGICPDCYKELYPELANNRIKRK